MLRTTPGVTPEDVTRGWTIVGSCATREELDQAIEDEPVLSEPDFHVAFRERSRQIPSDQPDPSLHPCRDDFFLLLHQRLHRRLATEAAAQPSKAQPADEPPSSSTSSVPAFFVSIQTALADRLPDEVNAPFEPLRDAPRIAERLEAITGHAVSLPPYEPVPGFRWNLLVVGCPRCEMRRVMLHAHWVDLYVLGARRSWRSRAEREARCPSCGCAVCVPLFVWVQEEPGPKDALAAAGVVIRVSPTEFIYRPAHGPLRDPRSDRIFEERFALGLENAAAAGDGAGGESETAEWLVIAYSDQECMDHIEAMRPDVSVPFAMDAFVSDVAQKLKTGVFSPSQVEASLRHPEVRLGADWPVALQRDMLASEPFKFLAHALVAEELARRRGAGTEIQALLASQTVRAYLSLEEPALAEIALVRAEDLLEGVGAGPGRDALHGDLQEQRAALLVKLGDHTSAAEIRATLRPPPPGPEAFRGRITSAQRQASLALSLFRSELIAKAFQTFRAVILQLEAMIEEIKQSTDTHEQRALPSLQNSLSGALANFGTLLTEMADFAELAGLLQAMDPESRVAPSVAAPDTQRALRERARELRARLDLRASKLQAFAEAAPHVEEYFAERGVPENERRPDTLRRFAQDLRERALSIAEAVGGWLFAARQAHQLALMLERAGQGDGAAAMMEKALKYGDRARDHHTLIHANMFFADRLVKREDGAGALPFVRAAAREAVRQIVGFGRHDRGRGAADAIAWRALQCARHGADPLEAIVVAESVKAVALAISLERPGQSSAPDSMVRDPDHAQWCDATGLDVDDPEKFRERLQSLKRTVYIGFFPGADRMWAYAAWGDCAIVEWTPLPEAPEDLPAPTSSGWSSDDALQRWARLLLHPLRAPLSTLRPEDRLIISAHEAIAHIPFAALPFEGDRLCQRAQLCHVQGSGLFSACVERAAPYRSLVCVGNPLRSDRPDLPDAEAEAEFAAVLFRSNGLDAQVLTRERATIRAVAAAASTADILHFACHADRPPGAPDGALPALLLAAGEPGDTGVLSGERIATELELKQGCLVSLVACQSAVHAGGAGPAVKGLVPALLVRGAAGVLASLWPIADRHALAFSREFYTGMVSGLGPAAALAMAQRAFLAGKYGEDGMLSENWAAYVLYGVR
jgi:CHAT domain